MSYLEAHFATVLQFFGLPYTEAGLQWVVLLLTTIAALVLCMVSVVVSLELKQHFSPKIERSCPCAECTPASMP